MTALNDLTDVTISSASQYDHLYYNGSGWVNNSTSFRVKDSGGYTYISSSASSNAILGLYDMANGASNGRAYISFHTGDESPTNVGFLGYTATASIIELKNSATDGTINITSDDGSIQLLGNHDLTFQVDSGRYLFFTNGTDTATLTIPIFEELENISTTTISAAQWGYLGELDQALKISSNPTFFSVTATEVKVGNEVELIKNNGRLYIEKIGESGKYVEIGVGSGTECVLKTGVSTFNFNQTIAEIGGVAISTGQWTLLGDLSSTLTAAELNYMDGVTSGVQAQLDNKLEVADVFPSGVQFYGVGQFTYSGMVDDGDDGIGAYGNSTTAGRWTCAFGGIPVKLTIGGTTKRLKLNSVKVSWWQNGASADLDRFWLRRMTTGGSAATVQDDGTNRGIGGYTETTWGSFSSSYDTLTADNQFFMLYIYHVALTSASDFRLNGVWVDYEYE
jgi:hypothetical protein